MRFFPTNGERNREKNVRNRFLNFVTWSAEESDKVENYRFLENCSMEFAENQGKKSVFNILSPPIIKNFKIGSENLRIFFDFTCAERQNFSKNRFFKFRFSSFWYSQLKEYLNVTTQLDFYRNQSSSFHETDYFQLCPISQLTRWRNSKIGLVHFFLYSFLRLLRKPHDDIWNG